MAITILDTPQVSNDTSTPEKFTPSLVAEDDSFMADLERPAIEAEEKLKEDLNAWRSDTLQKAEEATLDFDGFFPNKSPEVRRRMIVQATIEAELGWNSSSSSQFEIDRPQAAMRIFGEDVGRTDESFVQALTKRATERKEERDFYGELRGQATLSAIMGGQEIETTFGEKSKGNPVFEKNQGKAIQQWKETRNAVLDEYDDVLPVVRELNRAIETDETSAVIPLLENLSTEDFTKAAKLLGYIQKMEGEKESDRGVGGNLAESTQRDGESIGRKFKEGFLDILSGISAGSTGADYVAEDIEFRDKVNGFIAEVRRFRDQRDPIKLLSDEDSFWIRGAEQALYATPSVGFTVAGGMMPGGSVATMGLLIESSQEQYYLRAVDAGVEREEANKLAGSVAVPIAALQFLPERIGIGAVTKKLPVLSNVLNKLNSKLVRVTSGALIRGGAETVTEEVQSILQEVGNDVINGLKEDIPEADWDAHWSNFGERNLVTFLSIAPYSSMGAMVHDRGVSKSIEVANEATEEELVATGHERSVVQKFQKAETEQEKRDAFFEMIESQDPEREGTKEAADNIIAIQKKNLETQEEYKRLAISPGVRMSPDKKGYEVYNTRTGESMVTVETAQEATETVFSVFGIKESQRQAEFDELLSKFEAGRLDADQSGEMVEVETRTFTEADAMVELPGSDQRIQTERMLIEQRDGGTGEVTQEVMGEGSVIAGVSIPAGQMGRKEAATKIFNGSSVLTLIHERGHAKRRSLMKSGKWTRDQQIESITALDELITGDREGYRKAKLGNLTREEQDAILAKDRFLPADFKELSEAEQEVALDEAVAELAEVLALRTRKGGKSKMRGLINKNLAAMVRSRVPGAAQLSAFLKGLQEFFGLALKRAAVIKKAARDGKLDSAQLDALTDMLVGVTPQEQFEAERDAVPTTMIDGVEVDTPFSIGRADVTVNDDTEFYETKDGGLIGPASFSISAFHATPHKVDRFSTKNIGTGEGAQAYGWGLYFAQAKEVAKEYWNKFTNKFEDALFAGDQEIEFGNPDYDLLYDIMYEGADGVIRNQNELIDNLMKAGASDSNSVIKKARERIEKVPELVEKYGGEENLSLRKARTANLYTVNLKVEQDELLDWDKPLSEQSEGVRKALSEFDPDTQGRAVYEATQARQGLSAKWEEYMGGQWRIFDENGRDLGTHRDVEEDAGEQAAIQAHLSWQDLRNGVQGSAKAASEALSVLGIKGIRYLDGNSRSDGEGSFNYVIFNDADIEILEENGKPVEMGEPMQGPSFSISPVQDAEYLELAKNPEKNRGALQKMVDEAAKAAGYDSPKLYHGTKESFDRFGKSLSERPSVQRLRDLGLEAEYSNSYFLTEQEQVAQFYGTPRPFFVKFDNPFSNVGIVDELGFKGDDFTAIQEQALERGHDSIITTEMIDIPGDEADFIAELMPKDQAVREEAYSKLLSPVYIAFNPNQIKSADPVTRNADGNVIPLSQRFDESRDEISFSITPVQDAEYLELAKNPEKNRGALQKMVDAAAKALSWDTRSLYRGAPTKEEAEDFGVGGSHYSTDLDYALSYTEGNEEGLIEVYSKFKNTLDVGKIADESSSFNEFSEKLEQAGVPLNTPSDLFGWSQSKKYKDAKTIGDSLKILADNYSFESFVGNLNNNFTDELGSAVFPLGFDSIKSWEFENRTHPIFIISDDSVIESADPVTYDENGNVIPLSQRFDESKDEISFSIGDSRMLSRLSEEAKSRTKRPEARARIFGDIARSLNDLRRDVAKTKKAFGKEYEQPAIVDPRTMKSLRKEAAFRQAAWHEDLEEEILRKEGQALQSGDIPILKDMPVHGFIANVGKGFSGGAMESRSAFKKRTGRDPGAEYEGSEGLVGGLLYGGSRSPDQMAQELYSEGLISEDSPAAMWEALSTERESISDQQKGFKEAKAKLAGAKTEAKRRADEWLAEEIKKQDRDYNPTARIRRSLVMYDAILKSLPPEIRGKMGGFVTLSKLNTDAKRLEFLENRLGKADIYVEKWLQSEHRKQIKKIFKRARPKKTGKGVPKANLAAEFTDEVMRIEDLSKLSKEQVEKRQDKILEEMDKTTDQVESDKLSRDLVELIAFGDIANMNSLRLESMFQNLSTVFATGKMLKDFADAQFKAAADEVKEIVNHDVTGGAGPVPSSEAKSKEKKRKSIIVPGRFIGAEDVELSSLSDFHRKNLSFEWLINNLARANKAVGTLASKTHEKLSRMVHVATHEEKRANAAMQSRYQGFMASLLGVNFESKNGEPLEYKDLFGYNSAKAIKPGLQLSNAISEKFMTEVEQTGVIRIDYGGKGASSKKMIRAANIKSVIEGGVDIKSLGLSKAEWESAKKRYEERLKDLQEREDRSAAKAGRDPKTVSLKDNARIDYVSPNVGKPDNLTLSQSQAINLTMLFRQEGLKESMIHEGYTEETMAQMENFLSPESKALRDWLTEEYAENYNVINEVFKKANGVSLPQTEFYSPARRLAEGKVDDLSIDSSGTSAMSSNPNFLISRTKNFAEVDQTADALSIYMQHMVQTNHYVTWADPIKMLRTVFSDRVVKKNITDYAGHDLLKTISERIEWMADGGNRKASHIRFLDSLRAAHTYASLAFNWGVGIKQLTSLPAYAFDMGFKDFGKYAAKFLKNPLKNLREMMDTDYVKTRFKEGYERDVIDGLKKEGGMIMKGLQLGMLFGKTGDIVPVMIGGWMAKQRSYDASISKGMTEAEATQRAIVDFEMITDRAQQAGDLKDLSSFQGGGSIFKLFTMYKTSPRQYYANVFESALDAKAGKKGAKSELGRRFLIGQVILPLSFQFASDMLRNFIDDDDELDGADYLRAVLMGPLNGLFIAGDFAELFFSGIAGAKVWDEKIPVMDGFTKIMKANTHIRNGEFAEGIDDIARGIGRTVPSGFTFYEILRKEMKRFGVGD